MRVDDVFRHAITMQTV